MCGIVGYIGDKNAYTILIQGLKRLEYRGYDSAGVALMNGGIQLFKCKGKVSSLEEFISNKNTDGTVGIGHTRWATHGPPNDTNAHPHFSPSEDLVIIHNGIIENYATLKQGLIHRGYTFRSDTDTEVLVYLIEDIQKNEGVSLEKALRMALSEVVGAYALLLMSKSEPHQLLAAKKGSPLVIGIGENNSEFFIASDATPIVEHTKNVVYLEDEEIAIIRSGVPLEMKTIGNTPITPYIQYLQLELERLEKEGFEHFMLKEIHEQPRSVKDSLRGRVDAQNGRVSLGGILEYERKISQARRIIIIGCGTSWHAGLVGEYMIEDLARIPVEVEYASEFRYRDPIVYEDDIVLAISQSGETADTLAALQLAKHKGATILGICNVVGSSIARATHAGSYTHAGPEIGVASTKAFTAQVTVLTLFALMLGARKGTIPESKYRQLLLELESIPELISVVLKQDELIRSISAVYADSHNFLYLGRGHNFPVALEGALKLKEISYIHAEGYPAAEMKHGPIALIDEHMPVVVIATQGHSYEKVVSNIQEVKARGGKIISIVTEGDEQVRDLSDHCIQIPRVSEILSPLITVIPLQLLSYHIAVIRGCNVDQPRNLAKSVTVE
jgi:glutamine---fructose-6-phosphate transaminase (isomerizing)